MRGRRDEMRWNEREKRRDEMRVVEYKRREEKIREWISKVRRIDDKARKVYNAERWTSR